MLTSDLTHLTSQTTYQELALRCQEFLLYRGQDGSERGQLAEDMLFNLLVEYLVSAGMARPEAEGYCANCDNLTELALRISSVLGPALPGSRDR